ncbi:hypothetical protein I4U23_027158 [Adineta vaga]|nr:hypothetical protein I4U23_027158 [Adineta vaga]
MSSPALGKIVRVGVVLRNQITFYWNNIKQELMIMNLFKKESSSIQNVNIQEMVLIATRIYLGLLLICISVLVLFNGLSYVTVSVTILEPSLDTFEQLEAMYRETFTYQCEEITMVYNTFSTITPIFHQVCSSSFINSNWTTTLYGYGPKANSYLQFDRPLLSKQYQIMGWLCAEASAIVTSYLKNVNQQMIISTTTMSRVYFESTITDIVNQITRRLPVNYRRGYNLITELIHNSLLSNAFNTDWLLEFGNASNGYILRSVPYEYANDTCNCVVSKDCNQSLRIGPLDLVIPGLVVGCLPIDGLRMSSLECFFSQSCINTIINYLDYYMLMDGSLPSTDFSPPIVFNLSIIPLNRSLLSRFLPNSSIGTIMDELFIEEWTNKTNYEKYFSTCAPNICHYENIQHHTLLYVVTSLLALYGGLTVSLRLIVWNSLRFYQKFKEWYKPTNRIINIT